MKAKFILVSLILNTLFSLTVKADTIDFWHVYYNGDKIREYNSYIVDVISFKLASVMDNDSVTVKYFRDTPCFDCVTYVTVEDSKHNPVTRARGKGTFSPITFLLNNLTTTGAGIYNVYYAEGDSRKYADRVLLFRIKIE